jgi:RNA polymerase sigma-70 factor (ECF subfamily)
MATPTEIPGADPESRPADAARALHEQLRGAGPEREAAVAELHILLLKAARFELDRRRDSLPHLDGDDREDLAQQSADDALVAVLGKLDQFRGESRFTTWAYKFALLEAGVKARRRAWQEREIPIEDQAWAALADAGATAHNQAESRELIAALREEIERSLSPRQRQVLVAVALNDVPIDVLAERLDSSRGALYKTLHDGRRKLRLALAARGLSVGDETKERR